MVTHGQRPEQFSNVCTAHARPHVRRPSYCPSHRHQRPHRRQSVWWVLKVVLLDSSDAALAADYTAKLQLEGIGDLSIGIARADGSKCSRCWNYSSEVRLPLHSMLPLHTYLFLSPPAQHAAAPHFSISLSHCAACSPYTLLSLSPSL